METITKEVPSAFGEVAGNILGKMADATNTVTLAGEIGSLSKVVGSKVNDGVNFIVQNTFTDTITTTIPKTAVLPPSTTNKIASFISQKFKVGNQIRNAFRKSKHFIFVSRFGKRKCQSHQVSGCQ